MKTTVITIALAMMTVVAFGQENQQTKATDKIQTEEKAKTEDKVQTRRGPYFVDKTIMEYAIILKTELVPDVVRDEMPEV